MNLGRLFFKRPNPSCKYFEWWVPSRDEFNIPVCLAGDELLEAVIGVGDEMMDFVGASRNELKLISGHNNVKTLLLVIIAMVAYIVLKV